MPYINVDEAYILDNTGLQVDNSVDYANANSNRNLLDNPFFTNVVNQRGSASYSANAEAYWIDRWIANGSFSVSSAGLSCSSSSWYITQYFEEYRIISGEVYTLSALFSDGTVWSVTGTVTTSTGATSWQLLYGTQNTSGIALRHYSAARPWQVALWINTSKTVIAIKLEKGSYSTILNDTPPDYGEELDKCLYYFERVAPSSHVTLGWGYSEGNATTYFSTKIHPKRTQPTIPAYSLAVSGTNSMTISTTGLSIYSWSATGHTTIRFLAAAGSFTSGNLYRCGILNGGYIDFSADL